MSSNNNDRKSDNSLEQGFAQEDAQDAMVAAGAASKRRRDEAREQRERDAEEQKQKDAFQASLNAGSDSRRKRNK